MLRAIKIFWNKRNVANELIKILDECQKENELLRKQATDFRNRAISAEDNAANLSQQLRDARQNPQPTG